MMEVVTNIGAANDAKAPRYLNSLPFEGLSNSGSSHSEIYSANDTNYKTLPTYYVPSGSHPNQCYREIIGYGIFDNYTYTAGRGMVSLVGDTKSCTQVYYKKKNRKWGTPINFQTLLSNEASAETSRSIEIAPNPASDFVHIKLKNKSFINTISISNLLGNEMINHEMSPNTSEAKIDVSSLSNGIYLLKTKNGLKEHITRFVVAK